MESGDDDNDDGLKYNVSVKASAGADEFNLTDLTSLRTRMAQVCSVVRAVQATGYFQRLALLYLIDTGA